MEEMMVADVDNGIEVHQPLIRKEYEPSTKKNSQQYSQFDFVVQSEDF